LITLEAIHYEATAATTAYREMPSGTPRKAKEYRNELIAKLADLDDGIGEKFLEEKRNHA